jgi:hypothetical protein
MQMPLSRYIMLHVSLLSFSKNMQQEQQANIKR